MIIHGLSAYCFKDAEGDYFLILPENLFCTMSKIEKLFKLPMLFITGDTFTEIHDRRLEYNLAQRNTSMSLSEEIDKLCHTLGVHKNVFLGFYLDKRSLGDPEKDIVEFIYSLGKFFSILTCESVESTIDKFEKEVSEKEEIEVKRVF